MSATAAAPTAPAEDLAAAAKVMASVAPGVAAADLPPTRGQGS